MKHIRIVSAAAMVLAIAACHKNNDETNAQASDVASSEPAVVPPPSTTAAQMSGQDFANSVAASDAFEIQSAKLAEAQGHAPAIKSFAQQMVKAHTESTAKLKKAAAEASPAITPDASLKPDQRSQLDSLKAKTGMDFDTAYAQAQVSAHQEALDLLHHYALDSNVPSLKSFTEQAIPVVTAHLNMAKGLKPGG